MKHFSIFILLVVFSFLTFNFFGKSEITIPIEPVNPHELAFLHDFEKEFFEEFEKKGSPGAAVAIVKNNHILMAKGFGVKCVNSQDSVDANTVFRIGSLSKGFAGVLAAKLADEKIIDLNDPVVKYLPHFKLRSQRQTRAITIAHILSHTSGLPYHTYTTLIEAGWSLEEILPKFSKIRLIAPEGKVYAYQNAAFSLIELILEAATGKTYRELMFQYIIAPGGLYNTSLTYQALQKHDNKALPHKYRGRYRGWKKRELHDKYYNSAAAGGVNASITDMANWLQIVMGQRPDVISDAVLASAFTPQVNTMSSYRYNRNWPSLQDAHYGLGWRIFENETETLIYHGGFVNDFRAEIAFDPVEHIGICVLFNGAPGMAGSVIPKFFEKYNTYKSEIIEWDRQTDTAPLIH